MSTHGHPDDDARDQVLAFVLERLDDVQRASFEAHLASCAACQSELALLEPLSAALLEGVRAQAPPPGADLWERVRSRALAGPRPAPDLQPWRRWQPAAGEWVPASSPWEPSGVPGVETRRLHVEPGGDRVTMLVRMAPGATYPGHRHRGPEECFVVSGDLRVGRDLHMHAGDFQRVEDGSRHPVQSTVGGCVLLISCSTSDELLD